MDEKCKKIMECLSDYMDGEASEQLCKMVEKHIEECNECRCMLENIKVIIEMLHSLPEEDIPEDVEKSVLEQLKKILFE